MNNKRINFITDAAVIAAIYVVLTLLANALGLANYAIQVRFSEAFTILPFFTPAAVPGLFVGCILSNIVTGCLPLDIVFGSIATLIGALGTYYIAHGLKTTKDPGFYSTSTLRKWLCPIPPIISNMIIVPLILMNVYHFEGSLIYFMTTVGIGELIYCLVLGMILLFALEPRRNAIFGRD